MKAHQIFFFSGLFFISGVFLKSIEAGLSIVLVVLIFVVSFLFLYFLKNKKKFIALAFLSLIIFLGSFYYHFSDLNFKKTIPEYGKEIELSGVITNNPVLKDGSLNFYLRLDNKNNSKILVRVPKYPSFKYGDKIKVKGEIVKARYKSYRNYLVKEKVSGIMYSPKIVFLESGQGSLIKEELFSIRNKAHEVFKKNISPQEAAFLNGITLGGYEGFSFEFKEAMSVSGTTHLVALSGYNITIIIVVFSSLFLYLFSKKISYTLTSFLIIAFVLMTGAEASVVRAAIMGLIVILAYSSGRIYDIKNAIIFTVLVMILINPRVLVFDIGFQLSFLAVLGILYLKEPLQKLIKIGNKPGFLSWRDNLLTTASAQLAVAPILISNFGSFSPTSLLANVIILELIPVTMFLGFLILILSLLSYHSVLVFSWIAEALLLLETNFIKLFAKISVPLGINLGVLGFTFYYFVLYLIIIKTPKISKKI
jgi:competence protein ComEC